MAVDPMPIPALHIAPESCPTCARPMFLLAHVLGDIDGNRSRRFGGSLFEPYITALVSADRLSAADGLARWLAPPLPPSNQWRRLLRRAGIATMPAIVSALTLIGLAAQSTLTLTIIATAGLVFGSSGFFQMWIAELRTIRANHVTSYAEQRVRWEALVYCPSCHSVFMDDLAVRPDPRNVQLYVLRGTAPCQHHQMSARAA